MEPTDWITALKKIYPNNSMYYLRWESKRLYDIGSNIGGGLGKKAALSMVSSWAKQASKQAARKFNPLGMVLSTSGLLSNPWSVATVKAMQTGIVLADLIARTDSSYILCGHSLGVRVIFYTLKSLCTKNCHYIDSVHLLGGAVGNATEDWTDAVQAVKNDINNYYSQNDWVLLTLYKAGTFFFSDPVGRNPIKVDHPRMHNLDVSKFVSGHTEYKDNFPLFAHLPF